MSSSGAGLRERASERDGRRPSSRRRPVSPPARSAARPIAWQSSGALLIVLVFAAASLHVLLAQQLWLIYVVFVLTAVLGAAAGLRAMTRVRAAPTIAATALLTGLVTVFFAPATAVLGLIPTFDTFAEFSRILADAGRSISVQSVPAVADPSIVFTLCVGLGVIAVLADLLAVELRMPAVSGVLVLTVLAIPALVLEGISDPVLFVLTAAAFLLLLVVESPVRQPGTAAAIGAAAIVGTLVLPQLLPPIVPSVGSGGIGATTNVNPVVTLGDDLRRGVARPVIDYTTSTGEPHYLRLVSLEDFDGDEWEPRTPEADRANTVDGFGPVPGLSPEVPVSEEISVIDVSNLSTPYLPLPYPPRSVEGLAEGWLWEPDGLAVTKEGASARGLDYQVESLVLQPTPDQLLSAGVAVSPEIEQYLALPADLPALISETAASVASASPTNYEKAIALQEYFRSSAFTYSEDAPVDGDYDGTGMDVITVFLEERSGYCVHFASAMAIMARDLGIPARLAIGFLPGGARDDGFRVTTHDLHAWPELYFEGIGWVQFEPTPGRGELGAYADTGIEGVPSPPPDDDTPDPVPSSSAAPSAPQQPNGGLEGDGGGAGEQPADIGPAPWIALGLIGAFALSLVPAGIRIAQRRRLRVRLSAGDANALDVWHEVLRTAVDVGLPVTATKSPRETAASLGVGTDALGPLLAATEEKGYAATTVTDPRSLLQSLEGVRESLYSTAGGRKARLAKFYPRSVWRRIGHPLNSDADRDTGS